MADSWSTRHAGCTDSPRAWCPVGGTRPERGSTWFATYKTLCGEAKAKADPVLQRELNTRGLPRLSDDGRTTCRNRVSCRARPRAGVPISLQRVGVQSEPLISKCLRYQRLHRPSDSHTLPKRAPRGNLRDNTLYREVVYLLRHVINRQSNAPSCRRSHAFHRFTQRLTAVWPARRFHRFQRRPFGSLLVVRYTLLA